MLRIIFAAATALAAVCSGALAQDIRIAHVYDKTGPLEAYAKQSHIGLMMGLEYATGGTMQVAGRKVVGSAQVRIGTTLLQHGSLLLEDDQSVAADVTASPAGPGGEIPLSRALGRRVGWEEAADAVAAEFGARLGARPGVLEPAALGPGIERNGPVFRSDEWTWRR